LLVGWDQVPCTAATSGLLYQDIQHHPGYNGESHLSPVTHCPPFIQISVRHHV
jgi:hypothetical protein